MSSEYQTRAGALPDWVIEDLLADPTRKHALVRLDAAESPVAVVDLVKSIAADCHPEADLETACAHFRDQHLPKLTASGVVRYDSKRDAVALIDRTGQVRRRLDRS